MLQNLDILLKLIQEVADKHTDVDVLETAAKTLELLCNDEFAIYSRCDIARSSLLDMIVNKYKEANDEYLCLLDGVSLGLVDFVLSHINVNPVDISILCMNME